MEKIENVLEYECPCCGAGLRFGSKSQKLQCEYCDNQFDIGTVLAYNDAKEMPDQQTLSWEESSAKNWDAEENETVRAFRCSSCGGELITDDHTAATFCPYCGNPTIVPSRLSDALKPDAVIPFTKGKEDAKKAFLELCKGKPLLPKFFTQSQQIEKITGLYVPFWLYDCSSDFTGAYKATRIHRWSDSHYHYTKTDHFLLKRAANADFSGIPMDGSSKMDDIFMESIEPYDYSQLVEFDMSYLSGYYADKYDVPAEDGETRIQQRVDMAIQSELQPSMLGYATVIPTSKNTNIQHSKARYVLLPVWMLNTKYNGKVYTFAMNGQTGKMTGSFPICRKRACTWFIGICTIATAIAHLVQMLF